MAYFRSNLIVRVRTYLDSATLPGNAFNHPPANGFDSLYFSWMTITTTGFGDIAPLNVVRELLVHDGVWHGTDAPSIRRRNLFLVWRKPVVGASCSSSIYEMSYRQTIRPCLRGFGRPWPSLDIDIRHWPSASDQGFDTQVP